MPKVFRVVSSFSSWSQVFIGAFVIVVASVVWFGGASTQDDWSREPVGWLFLLVSVTVGTFQTWVGLKMPRRITLRDDGVLELKSLRGNETIHARDIVWMKPYASTLRVKLERGFRYWHRDYSGLHELLSLLKEHNPRIEMRGL